MGFEDFALPGYLVENIRQEGWESPTPVQSLVIPEALAGCDILGGAPTGTGKSAAFLIPVIARLALQPQVGGIRVLILEPSRELALQVSAVAGRLLRGSGMESMALIGGAAREVQREGICAIVAATPGRLGEFLRKAWFDPATVEILVIDEADRMLDMGFRDEVTAITGALTGRRQSMLFSATLEGAGIREFADRVLKDPVEIKLGAGQEHAEKLPEQLQLRAYYAPSDELKLAILTRLLTTVRQRSLVFVKTRARLQRLESSLRRRGFRCSSLQGELSQNERIASLRRFLAEPEGILIATDVAARGLDLPEVDCVYNFDMPANAAIFTHRAGRTARAGRSGLAISFIRPEELEVLGRILRYTGRTVEKRSMADPATSFPEESGSGVRPLKSAGAGRAKKNAAALHGQAERERRKHPKDRLRNRKNKGKPDFAAKRARKAARAAAHLLHET